MASSKEYLEFVCDQIAGAGRIREKKMFGEYLVYVNDKPVLLVCDNTVFVKQLPELAGKLHDAQTGAPYQGAKEHYILDIENRELSLEVVQILEQLVSIPVPSKKKAAK